MNIEKSIYPYNPELEGLPFLLRGIGGSSYQGHIDRPEGYQWHQILYSAGGRGCLVHDGMTEEIGERTFIFLPAQAPHEYYPLTESWEVDWIAFDGAGCKAALEKLEMGGVITAGARDPSAMQQIFTAMLESQRTDILYSGLTCSALVYDYIIGFRRLFNTEADVRRSRQLSVLMPALRYIYDHYAEDIPIPFLAELTGVTHQHFCRIFKSALNMRPNDYLTGRRIDEACRMLRESELTVAEISAACGYGDPSYFSTVFKRHTGLSPAAYRLTKERG